MAETHASWDPLFGARAVCPYRGHEIRDLWDFGLRDEDSTETECEECERMFHLRCRVEVSYSTEPIAPSPAPEAPCSETKEDSQ